MVSRLLAKSSRTPDSPEDFETLAGHLKLVGGAARRISEVRGLQILSALGLPERYWTDLTEATVLAAVLHDIGKASEDFQHLVRGSRRVPQALRHEIVGLWLLCHEPALSDWVFSGLTPESRDTIVRAVVGHHLKFHNVDSLQPQATGSLRARVLTGHPDFMAVLEIIQRTRGLRPPPQLPDLAIALDGPLAEVEDYVREKYAHWQKTPHTEGAFDAAVSALLVAADVCGSALSRPGIAPAEWLTPALSEVCSASNLNAVAEVGFRGREPRAFQTKVADSPARVTLVHAGCGTGKTAAAYLWASRQASGRKLFFCYPTTGTASEGFFTYWNELGSAALVHSRAQYDIERICDNGRDEDALLESQVSYRGLLPWSAKATVCTVDTVLGLLQNHRTGLTASPAILGGGFVFDELHLYDEELFGTLLRFLQAIPGVPVLLMTASLQPSRRAAIKQVLQHAGDEVVEVDGPQELEELPRYRMTAASAEEAEREVGAALAAGKRVLWVANTVDRCIRIARELEAKGASVEPYHSRYRYEDRVERHSSVTSPFGRGSQAGAVLAVTTQVCEVSLDISADLLVSDLAPAPSLVQRLGRLNRWAQPGDGSEPCLALIVDVPSTAPYQRWDPDESRRWLDSLTGRAISQADLRSAFESVMAGQPIPAPRLSAWLDKGWEEIRPLTLRALSPSLTVVREEDEANCFDTRDRANPVQIVANSIPMPFWPVQKEFEGWRRLGGFVPVAPQGRIEYSPKWGAAWK